MKRNRNTWWILAAMGAVLALPLELPRKVLAAFFNTDLFDVDAEIYQ